MATFKVKFTEPGTMKAFFGEHIETVTSDYEKLVNLPQINSVELIGNKTSDELALQDEMDAISNLEINSLFN